MDEDKRGSLPEPVVRDALAVKFDLSHGAEMGSALSLHYPAWPKLFRRRCCEGVAAAYWRVQTGRAAGEHRKQSTKDGEFACCGVIRSR
jgi:hypothetical protein